jgi:hypothetical protein
MSRHSKPSEQHDRTAIVVTSVDETEHIPQVPLPVPRGWILVPIKWLNSVVCILLGAVTIGSQIWVKVVQHEDPSIALLVAGGSLLGIVLPGIWAGGRNGAK